MTMTHMLSESASLAARKSSDSETFFPRVRISPLLRIGIVQDQDDNDIELLIMKMRRIMMRVMSRIIRVRIKSMLVLIDD